MKLKWQPSFFPPMQTDGRTDMTKLTVAFRNFANAPKKRRKIWRMRRNSMLLYFSSFLFSSLHDRKQSTVTSTN